MVAVDTLMFGLVAIGWLAIGLVFGFGQLATGIAAVGQAAIGAWFALGQIAIGQIAYGKYVLAQIGFGEHIYSMARKDAEAIEFFKTLPVVRHLLP